MDHAHEANPDNADPYHFPKSSLIDDLEFLAEGMNFGVSGRFLMIFVNSLRQNRENVDGSSGCRDCAAAAELNQGR